MVSGIIIPKRFVTTPFDLSPEEWIDLRTIVLQAKDHIETRHVPDGYNLGWNVGAVAGQEIDHLHLHIIPRYADEPLAGQGIRYAIKQPENRRPDANQKNAAPVGVETLQCKVSTPTGAAASTNLANRRLDIVERRLLVLADEFLTHPQEAALFRCGGD